MNKIIKSYENISSIADNYDAFLVDLWGVIHDGRELYPGVIKCLDKLKENNKHIIFLSNAPRRAYKAVQVLEKLGVTPNLYDAIITSGEVTFEYIKSGKHNYNTHYIMIGPDKDKHLLDNSGYLMTSDYSKASFAVVTGFDNDDSVIEDVIKDLAKCLKHKLPLICANPDYVVVRIDGTRALCAGVIADKYKEMGGDIKSFGKPYEEVYQKALNELCIKDTTRVAAIGDNLNTDIQGANKQNISSYLIVGGILGEELNIKHGELPDTKKLQNLCLDYGIYPSSVLPAFIWE